MGRSRLLSCLVVVSLSAVAQAVDTLPPTIIATPPAFPAPGTPLVVECRIIDDSEIFDPTVFWRVAGASSWERAALEASGEVYRASFEPPAGASALELFIEAFDIEGNGPARFGTPDAPVRVSPTVALAAKRVQDAPPQALLDGFDPPEMAGQQATWRKPTAVGLWVAGALLAAGGAVALAVHRSEANTFNERFYAEGRFDDAERGSIETMGALGAGLLATGGVALAGGTVLWVVEF